VRTLTIVKAAINIAINELDLDCKNVFAGIRVKGSGASKTDRLSITEEQLEGASQHFLNDHLAAALFVTLRDTGGRVAEVTGLLVRDIDLEQLTLTIKSNDH
jgi:integrase